MKAASSDWEDFPSYYEVLHSINEYLNGNYRQELIVKREIVPVEPKWNYFNFSAFDISVVIILAIMWTALRNLAEEVVFKPLGHYCSLTAANQKKMPESAWKFVYYLCAFSYNCYVLILSGDYQFFQKPSTVWDGWSLTQSLPLKMYLLYVAQCGFYFHSLYATIFMDTWRKDSYLMLIHHFSTLLLISFSFTLRCHNIGAFVLFFHDVCDIFLEFSKLNVYFKEQNNKIVQIHEILANISFLCFTTAWYVARLYWYPLRVLYTAISNVPCSLLMNSLLWILQVLNIYWFFFIIQVLVRVVTGQFQEGDDIREYDVQERWNQKKTPIPSNNEKCERVVENGAGKESVVMAYSEMAM